MWASHRHREGLNLLGTGGYWQNDKTSVPPWLNRKRWRSRPIRADRYRKQEVCSFRAWEHDWTFPRGERQLFPRAVLFRIGLSATRRRLRDTRETGLGLTFTRKTANVVKVNCRKKDAAYEAKHDDFDAQFFFFFLKLPQAFTEEWIRLSAFFILQPQSNE